MALIGLKKRADTDTIPFKRKEFRMAEENENTKTEQRGPEDQQRLFGAEKIRKAAEDHVGKPPQNLMPPFPGEESPPAAASSDSSGDSTHQETQQD
jgi:hypothetical protein